MLLLLLLFRLIGSFTFASSEIMDFVSIVYALRVLLCECMQLVCVNVYVLMWAESALYVHRRATDVLLWYDGKLSSTGLSSLVSSISFVLDLSGHEYQTRERERKRERWRTYTRIHINTPSWVRRREHRHHRINITKRIFTQKEQRMHLIIDIFSHIWNIVYGIAYICGSNAICILNFQSNWNQLVPLTQIVKTSMHNSAWKPSYEGAKRLVGRTQP